MKTLLVPVDLSAASTRVCDAACTLAQLTGARLVLLHVVLPPFTGMAEYYAFDGSSIAAVTMAAEQAAEKRLKTLARRCARRRVPVRTIRRVGSALPVILQHVKSTRATYIVIGSHGHGGMYELLLGSTTSGVLRKARCPVLVVPIRAH